MGYRIQYRTPDGRRHESALGFSRFSDALEALVVMRALDARYGCGCDFWMAPKRARQYGRYSGKIGPAFEMDEVA